MQQRLAQRVEQLETQLAFQDDTIDQLNQLVTRQNHELQRLQQQFRLLAEKYRELAPDDDPQQQEERPPHY